MKKLTVLSLATLALAGMASTANAQLLANFQASSFNSTADTLTDTVGGIVATGAGDTAGTGDVNIGSGFTFNADAISGLEGLTNYTIALGFTSSATQNEGLFGGDLPLAGAGDAQLASEGSGTGFQLHSLLGNSTGGDNNLYSVSSGNFNYNAGMTDTGLVAGAASGVVLVVAGSSVQLYVNGNLQDSQTFTVSPFGYSASSNTALGTPTTSYSFGIGTDSGNSVDYNANGLQGDITQFQIYSGADNSTTAEALSLSVAAPSVSTPTIPEPSTWALMLGGLGALAFVARRQIKLS